MKGKRTFIAFLGLLGLSLGFFASAGFSKEPGDTPTANRAEERSAAIAEAKHLFDEGNYREAWERFEPIALKPDTRSRDVVEALTYGLKSLWNLNRADQVDTFRQKVVDAHPGEWRVLWRAAKSCYEQTHDGYLIAGEFHRGGHRGGGQWASAYERDRVQTLRWMDLARPLALEDPDRPEVAAFLIDYARMWLVDAQGPQAWRLQALTDLKELPDYDRERRYGFPGRSPGAPVDAEGNPVFYTVPDTFEAAENDGQRMRWCLARAAQVDPRRRVETEMLWAEFCRQQFGVQTVLHGGSGVAPFQRGGPLPQKKWVLQFTQLDDDETIARVADGVKRFRLPPGSNYIEIYRRTAVDAEATRAQKLDALENLVSVFGARRQYPRVAETARQILAQLKKTKAEPEKIQSWEARLKQITGAWGQFEPVEGQAAGSGATVEYRFRNGDQVEFTAHEIKVEKLLADIQERIRNHKPEEDRDWRWHNLDDLGYFLIEKNQKEYLGAKVADWSMKLDPLVGHFDRRVTVTTPLSRAGAYLVEARMENGNRSWIVLWVRDTAILKKRMNDENLYYIADAKTGRPIEKAHVEFFGFGSERAPRRPIGRSRNTQAFRPRIETVRFAEYSDKDGQAVVEKRQMPDRYSWLVTARTEDGRFAYLGFDRIRFASRHESPYRTAKTYFLTDRPVYRPDQTVHYHFWARQARYDLGDVSTFAGRTFTLTLNDPKGEKVFEKTVTADSYGGVEGQWTLPEEATLGVWRFSVREGKPGRKRHYLGRGQFRVEEYKKPEFEVTVDAPKEPVALGEKITATIRADYYFGSPVVDATVKYKVLRNRVDDRWYPLGPWDWLYGRGYGWLGGDAKWFPGWSDWGCPAPLPPWWRGGSPPPELIEENEVKIGPDGTVKIEIDTADALGKYPDRDHRYTITAEVTDLSRRAIVGRGTVLVARKPFEVYVSLDRGYFRVGQPIRADFQARRIDGQPVQGQGHVELLKVRYEKGQPIETPVQSWDVATDAAGKASLKLTASQPGQYRLSYKLTDSSGLESGHEIEGGRLFLVTGEGFDGRDFRFNQLELIPDQKTYRPGEKVRLRINTDRPGSTVLLFVRPSSGVYPKPHLLRLEGKSTVFEIDVHEADRPNFFVEAITVADGRVYSQSRQILVPPEKRILNVAVEPSQEIFRPGEKAKVKIRLTDLEGKPFIGTTVVSIYDKAIDYISGGLKPADIKTFFWSWLRHHQPRTESNLKGWSLPLVKEGEASMESLGTLEPDDSLAPRGGSFGNGVDYEMVKSAAPRSRGVAVLAAQPMAEASKADGEGAGGGEPLVEPTVRKQFADTALWVGNLETDADGTAEVELAMPENLTTWKIGVWAMGQGTRVGQGATEVITRKDLILRLQAPRFLVETDEVVLSAVIHNYLKNDKRLEVHLELDGPCLVPLDVKGETTDKPSVQKVSIPAGGETRVDWSVRAEREGEAVVRMKALSDEESDAMEVRLPVLVHGMLKTDSYSGALRNNENNGRLTVNVPVERQADLTRLVVRYSPTLAGAMVDALPYLADYPYGCTEQTLNRFLPTVITQKILLESGVDLKKIRDKRANLNAQQLGDPQKRASRWKRFERNPVFDSEEVDRMVKQGVTRLVSMQCADGGWGWFSGWGERSYPHTTAIVVHGLFLAEQNGVALPRGVREKGIEWLAGYQARELEKLRNAEKKLKKVPVKSSADQLDALVLMVLAESGVKNEQTKAMVGYLDRDRTRLTPYALALFGQAADRLGQADVRDRVIRNLSQFVVEDDENQTAYLNIPDAYRWYWYGSRFETQAAFLKLLCRTEPKNRLTSRLVKYLLNGRQNGTYWTSTRDTAACIEAMADYLRSSGEDRPDLTVSVFVDGVERKQVRITRENLFEFDDRLVLEGDALSAGAHTIEIKKTGSGPLYYNAYMTNFTKEPYITAAGLEVKVARRYYRLVPEEKTVAAAGSHGQVLDRRVEKFRREALENLATVESGDLVEVELVIESKNDYEYLIFEDPKPAGFEAVSVRSGYTGNEMGAYVEFRDEKVVFFVRQLAHGRHSVSYRLRSEVPGRFSALPAEGEGMYAPELKGNSDEMKVKVVDKKK